MTTFFETEKFVTILKMNVRDHNFFYLIGSYYEEFLVIYVQDVLIFFKVSILWKSDEIISCCWLVILYKTCLMNPSLEVTRRERASREENPPFSTAGARQQRYISINSRVASPEPCDLGRIRIRSYHQNEKILRI